MKNYFLMCLSMLLLSYFTYAQMSYVTLDTIKGRGNAMDTIIKKKTALSFGKTFPNNYKRDENVAQTLRPYMVAHIIDPTERSHPLYRAQVKEATEKLALDKADILKYMKISETVGERMAKAGIYSEAEFNAIKFIYLPVYCLTVNVVNFKNGENIAKYYSLGLGGFKYLMLRDNKLIGYLNFYPSRTQLKSDFFLARSREVEILDQLLKQGKTPIGLTNSVCIDPKVIGAGNGYMFGYVEQGHVVYSYYSEGVIQQIGTDSYVAPNPRFYKYYTTETAESFLSSSGNGSTINGWLDTAVDHLKKYPKKRQ